jgi:hypothetical protein
MRYDIELKARKNPLASAVIGRLTLTSDNSCAYSGEVDRPFRRNVTGDSAESAL